MKTAMHKSIDNERFSWKNSSTILASWWLLIYNYAIRKEDRSNNAILDSGIFFKYTVSVIKLTYQTDDECYFYEEAVDIENTTLFTLTVYLQLHCQTSEYTEL